MIHKKILIIMLLITCAFCLKNRTVEAQAQEVRGVWVSCYDYEKAGLSNQTEANFRANAAKLFENMKSYGCNTVYFHVRSYDDAIYPSMNFGWSKYLTNQPLNYDPLKILIEEAHNRGISFQAWLNPYRITLTQVLDPANPATTDRILTAVREIITNYAVDGIHFDDYFYPGKTHPQYKLYKNLTTDQKKANVNAMIRSIYSYIKSVNPNLVFGISPAGAMDYCRSIGGDIDTWLSQEGYVDYIAPQIYWSNSYILKGKKTRLYDNRISEWNSLNVLKKPMYIGLALYRSNMRSSLDLGWKKSTSNLAYQINKLRSSGEQGYILFSYQNLIDRTNTKKELANYLKTIADLKVSSTSKTMKKGKKYQIKLNIDPSKAKSLVSWKSTNKKVASVKSNGTVTAKKKGKTVIIAKLASAKYVSYTLTIK